MYKEQIKEILQSVKENKIKEEDAMEKLKNLPYEDIGFAKIDHHRAIRRGFPEVVFCQNKSVKQVVEIVKRMAANNDVLATRATKEEAGTITIKNNNNWNSQKINNKKIKKLKKILIITAGTSDIRVAEEAAVTAEMLGNKVERLYDAGVAGIHRLLSHKEKIENADVVIVVAGMDGALPSVVFPQPEASQPA